jgi:anti-sigma factor RsiW
MSDCRRTAERLTPFVDGLLPPAERAQVERHLAECPPCRTWAAEADEGRAVLRERGPLLATESLPPGLRSRCESLAREHAQVHSPHWRRLVPGLAALSLVGATVLILFAMATGRSSVLLAQQLIVDHWKCVRFSSPVTPLDSSEATQALERRHGWNRRVPPSSAADGVTLVGVRRCMYGLGSIPHVIYRAGDQHLSLFVLNGVTRPRADVETLGYHSTIWSDGPSTYVLVSERADAGLSRGARYVMESLR